MAIVNIDFLSIKILIGEGNIEGGFSVNKDPIVSIKLLTAWYKSMDLWSPILNWCYCHLFNSFGKTIN